MLMMRGLCGSWCRLRPTDADDARLLRDLEYTEAG